MRILLAVCLLHLGYFQKAVAQDSTLVLTLDGIYSQVLNNHPVARQANLLSESAQMNIRISRGYFDPKVYSQYSGKEFKGSNYYRLWDSHLKIPMWVGDLKVGYEKNTGINLNPQSDTNSGKGLAYAGIELPILQGMLIDERRAALREAQAMQQEAEAERVNKINKLMLQIAKDYWTWYFAYHQYQLAEKGFNLAKFRYNAVKQEVVQGTLAAIDSTEAKITIQQREIDLKMALLELNNSRLVLSNHLWDENGSPLEMDSELRPVERPSVSLTDIDMAQLEQMAAQQHPELRLIDSKLSQLEVQRKLAAEMLKPTLNLKYNFLSKTPISSNEYNMDFFEENYKLGVDFSFPLFLRKERGKLKLTKVKLEQTGLKRVEASRTIQNNLRAQYNKANNLNNLVSMQAEMAQNYRKLLSGEEQKFQAGESSVFYVTVREGKLLEAETKLFKIWSEFAKSIAELKWAAGLGVQ
ncbi:TolC family protein [Limibacter armeniacum]|uniref:TolC family protein n=1 Tax=Limibacter armeniacum TaxID=466084 RepID=UPI002FE5C391